MALAASPNSKANLPSPVANSNKKTKKTINNNNNNSSLEVKEATDEVMNFDNNPTSKPQLKRNSNPGVRVIHGRIYDSQNGTTCHQCRQKTYAVFASCKNQEKAKPCPIKYCCTCLLNRYGQKVEDVALLDKWDCPKCRGDCNCSICRKKRGQMPTGMVSPMAKAGGFSSVSDMIVAKGDENVCNYKRVKETIGSPKKQADTAEALAIKSPKKPGKENLFDGKTDLNANPPVSVPLPDEKKPKKVKRKGFEVKPHDNAANDVLEIKTNNTLNENNQKKLKTQESKETVEGNAVEQKPKKVKRKGPEVKLDGNAVIDVSVTETNDTLNKKKQKKLKTKESKETVEGNEVKENNIIQDQDTNQQLEDNQSLIAKKTTLNLFESVIPLPSGTELVTVVGVDLPKEDAGNALQLLEFCSTFGKALDLKKGQAEAVLRDLINGRSTRRGKFTSVIQFHIQLLSVIQEESESESESDSPTSNLTHGNDSWLKALKSCISKSKVKDMESIDLTAGGYDDLASSTKLKVLVFLCDEVLETEKIRNWIDDQNAKFAEKKKEAKEKLSVAKDKEKTLKQQMQDEIAKAIVANEGVPITLKEHDAILSKIKIKAAEAHAEMLACKEMVPLDKMRPDAVRVEPIFKDNNGHMYWRLKKCSEKPGILLQDIGTGDHTVEVVDKWFEYDDEQMDVIEKHINVLRSRFRKYYKN
ncbi:uncharacterized protein LOC143637155 [Bidens hawaiensis]|uniref:uncharacterized protein LOC143637155 n=1 Tax=Bidens hawaiensis TaxID=980011 RepID=UPI00404A2D37